MDSSDRATLTQLERQLAKDPGAGHLLRMAERITRRTGAYGLLADFLANAVLAVPGPRKRELCMTLGNLYRDDIGFGEEAARWYLQALEESPKAQPPFDALVPICRESGQWEILLDACLLRAGAVPEEAAQLKREAALLRQEHDDDPMLAVHLFEEVFALSPGDPVAAEVLAQHYAEMEEWEKLVGIYEGMLAVCDDRDGRVDLLKKLALLRETVVQDADAAASSLQQLADLTPDDYDTLRELERLYTQQGNRDQLADVIRRLVPHAETVADKVELLLRLADLAQARGDHAQAIAACREIADLDPGQVAALDRLEELYAGQTDWIELVALLDRRLHMADDVEQVVDYFQRKGDIYRVEMANDAAAEEQYRNALEFAPGHPALMGRMVDLLLAGGKADKAMEFLLRRTRHSEDEKEQAGLLTWMAAIARDHLGDEDNSVELLEAALQRDPSHLDAAAALVDLRRARREWVRALPLMEALRTAAEERNDRKLEADWLAGMGEALVAMGRHGDAITCLRTAYDKGNDRPDVLRQLGKLNLQQGNPAVAATYYRRYVDQLSVEELAREGADVYGTMARIERALGNDDAAQEWFEKALAHAPEDATAIGELIRVAEDRDDHAQANDHRRHLLSLQDDETERLTTLLAIGDCCRTSLEDPEGAVLAYQEARELAPQSKLPLLKLLECQGRAGNQEAVVDVLKDLTELETDPVRVRQFAFTRANLLHREMERVADALAAYDRVLEVDPEHIESLKAIIELQTVSQAWEGLEATYLTLLTRLERRGRRDLEHVLYRGLGELYETQMDRPDEAVEAYRLALARKEDDRELLAVLAELLQRLERFDEAEDVYRSLVHHAPDSTPAYRRLGALLRRRGDLAGAWHAVSVLAALGRARDEEQDWLRDNRPAPAAVALSAEHWHSALRADGQDRQLSELFGLLATALGSEVPTRRLKELELNRKQRIDPAGDSPLARILQRTCTLLGLQQPEIYRASHLEGFLIQPTAPPVLAVGETWLAETPPSTLAFLLGRAMTWFHPWHVLTAYLPQDGLRFLLSAATSLVRPSGDHPAMEDPDVLAIHRRLTRSLDDDGHNTLERLVRDLSTTHIGRWMAGIELTSNHAGLWVCGDIRTALAGLKADPTVRTQLPKAEQARELAAYAVSEKFNSLPR